MRKQEKPSRNRADGEGVLFVFNSNAEVNLKQYSTADDTMTSSGTDEPISLAQRRPRRARQSIDYAEEEKQKQLSNIDNNMKITNGPSSRRKREPSFSSVDSNPNNICQSCYCPCKNPSKIRINKHHHINPFYSPYAVYATLQGGSPYLTSNAVWNSQTAYETVSPRPTTAMIPIETRHLCEICSALFITHGLQCDTCSYIPRMDERIFRDCTRCFEGVICRM